MADHLLIDAGDRLLTESGELIAIGSTWTSPTQSGAAFAGRVKQPGETPAAHALMRHYGTVTEGRNFYILEDGSVTEQDPADWDDVVRVLWGAHEEPVSDDEVALLTAAGYGAYVDGGA